MTMTIKAQARTKVGKGAARQARREGLVPAVIYGSGKTPEGVNLNARDLQLAMQAGGFYTNVHEIEIDGKAQKVLARDLQRNVINEVVTHVDFLRFDPKREIKVNVTVHVIDEEKSPGLKKGGVLQLVRPEIEVICRADSIPSYLEVSMEGLDVTESAHSSSMTFPEGVRPSIDRDFTVATIVSTRTSTLSDMGEETAEGEVAEGEESSAE